MSRPRILFIVVSIAVLALGAIGVRQRAGGQQGWPERFTAKRDILLLPPPVDDELRAEFSLCEGPIRINCVVDGDTFWYKGDKIRVADIDAPEIFSAHCPDERSIGEAARDRLLVLLNADGFTMRSETRDTDRYGRKLRIVTRAGRSLGERLVEEALARRWNEPRRDWCAVH